MGLTEYDKKRRFTKTPEPGPKEKRSKSGRLFVIQKHRATRLHYDFRLESEGVLKSWAVPKGPSLDPSVKRLAMEVEDHPVDYADFEGIIPEGEYGGGTVMVWDQGTYESEKSDTISSDIHRGEVKFTLHGEKLNGSWALVRTNDRQWLLIKHRDEYAITEEVAELQPFSVITGRTLAEIAEDEGGNVKKAATGDPAVVPPHKRVKKSSKSKPSVWHSNRETQEEKPSGKAPKRRQKKLTMPDGARKAAMPSQITPMLATLVEAPFKDKNWIFEIKWDGVRAICFLESGEIRFVSRTRNEMTAQYPELSQIAGDISAETAILDGEIVALDENGVPRFQLLQPRFGRKRNQVSTDRLTIVYYVFDLINCNGYDLTNCRLEDRRELLQQIVQVTDKLRFSDSVKEEGEQFFSLVEGRGLEGIVGKRLDSKYVQKRTKDWLKVKATKRQEVVIGGYSKPRGERSYFGALIVGLYEGKDKLRYVSHAGGGFNQKLLADIYERLQPLKTDKSPFVATPKTNEKVQWVRPELVCEVKFSEWTNDWNMRHPIFLGLREDTDPKDCRFEFPQVTETEPEQTAADTESRNLKTSRDEPSPASALLKRPLKGNLQVRIRRNTLSLTNLDKVYWPEDGYTKGDLVRYYYEIATTLIPYYKDRPLIMKRYPNGITGHVFHQHNLEKPPAYVETYTREREPRKESVVYGLVNNVETLLYLANLGAVSLHPWSSRPATLEQPDWIIFDVDPGEATFHTVCDVALEVKKVLDEIGLEGFPKTSGSKGIHVFVPVKPK